MTFPANGGTWLSTTEFAFFVVFLFIITVFLGLRLWSRTLQKGLRPRALTVSDYVVIIGYLATVGQTVCMVVATSIGGSGQHVDRLSDEVQQKGQKALFTAAFFWITATSTLKMSILLLYIEIFNSQTPRRIAYGMLAVVGAFFLGFLVAIFTQCFPFSMNWDKYETGRCGNLAAEAKAGSFLNMIFDITLTVFPIPMVWGLQMPVRKRIGLIVLFGLGTVADSITVARAAITMNPSGQDYSYFSAKTNILAGMELWLGVIIACTPLIKPALARMHITTPSAGPSRLSKGSGSQPIYRSDPEATPSSGLSSMKKGSSECTSLKKVDAWERQFLYLESDSEDALPLRDLSHCSTPEPPRAYLSPPR